MNVKEKSNSIWEKLLPRQQTCLTYYWSGLPRWKAAKHAGYKGKTKSALAHTCSFIIKRYVSEASQEEILDSCGLDRVSWARNVLWLIRHAKAKKDLKALATGLKLAGEARFILKHLEDEGEKGATIIINTDGKAEKKKPEEVKKGPARVVSLASMED